MSGTRAPSLFSSRCWQLAYGKAVLHACVAGRKGANQAKEAISKKRVGSAKGRRQNEMRERRDSVSSGGLRAFEEAKGCAATTRRLVLLENNRGGHRVLLLLQGQKERTRACAYKPSSAKGQQAMYQLPFAAPMRSTNKASTQIAHIVHAARRQSIYKCQSRACLPAGYACVQSISNRKECRQEGGRSSAASSGCKQVAVPAA